MVAARSNSRVKFFKIMGALKASLVFCGLSVVLAGCGASIKNRTDLAKDIALSDHMQRIEIYAKPFNITGFAAYAPQPVATGRVYIEGDGLAWISKTQPSLNPTPINPFALRLAERDNYAERIYLSRPCQYSGWDGEGPCPMKYWTTHRYAPEVVAAYIDVIEQLKTARGWREVELIGYSGGGALALLIAAARDDIASVRTVAGNLDIDAHSQIHRVDFMRASHNPANYAHKLAAIPQYHFIGGEDVIVPLGVAQSYLTKFSDQRCVKLLRIAGATHEDGWLERWPAFLNKPLPCKR